jgi:hypothetical protein
VFCFFQLQARANYAHVQNIYCSQLRIIVHVPLTNVLLMTSHCYSLSQLSTQHDRDNSRWYVYTWHHITQTYRQKCNKCWWHLQQHNNLASLLLQDKVLSTKSSL